MPEKQISSFADLANTKMSDVEKPKPLPVGHYQAVIGGRFKERKAKSGTLGADFPVKLIAPMPDVDGDALEAAGGIKPDRQYSLTFWMTQDSLWRVKEFAKSAFGATDNQGLMDVLETIGTSGQPFMVEGKHRTQDNGDVIFNLDNPAALESYKDPS